MKTKISKLDNKGRGITYINDKITFVNNALEGEEVILSNVIESKKYNEANAIDIIESSKERIIPKCPYYKECGGCNIMHMNYEAQCNFKLNKVKDIINKYANITPEIKIVQNDKELFYRNKISLKIQDYKWGYYNDNTHDFVMIKSCLLAKNSINDIIHDKELFKISNGSIVIRTNYLNEILISITTDEPYEIDYDNLKDNIIGIVVNNKTVYKDNYIYDLIGDYEYKITYDAFFQVNNFIANNIFILLNSYLKGDTLLDLYCGVGTLGISLKDNFKEIYGIEINKNAIKDAIENAKLNEVNNAHYYAGDTYKILKTINKSFDTVIVDPPRSGLNKATISLIKEINPNTIAYVSCDPITLARDLKILSDKYDVIKLNALDMFPNTYNCESIAVLERR